MAGGRLRRRHRVGALVENEAIAAQRADPLADDAAAVDVPVGDAQPQLTEADALIAYMQVLGTMVDFSTFTPDASR